MNTTSASLLQRLRTPGAPDAWSRFVDLYTPLLFHWAKQTGLQETDAADVVQDILVTLLERLPGFEYQPGRGFRNWLWTVTRNKCRERGRREALRRGQTLPELADPHQDDPAAAVAEDDYRDFVLRQALVCMQQEFQSVTWQACWEHVVKGRPATDVAGELGITVNAVYLAKSRVLRRLRQELAGLLD